MKAAIAMDPIIRDMRALADSIDDDDEYRMEFKKAVEDLMGFVTAKIVFPLEIRYPELNPD